MFKRKRFFLTEGSKPRSRMSLHSIRDEEELSPSILKDIPEGDCNVLVINDSHEMASEITLQLTLKIPGCSIMYAPTLELARWMIRRRPIHLVVSSPILPDGSVAKLKEAFAELATPPDLVVVGDINVKNAELFQDLGYDTLTVKKIRTSAPKPAAKGAGISRSIKTLGADIRNDLNNPLQEIVAMVFVAQASGKSPAAEKALEAIDKAAKNMASVVSKLEDKIREAVKPYSAAV